ncbi:phospholipase D-like domain-containing protein [Neoroseomonas oryzicola]|uniref:Phospholipase D n=1 Tax=Neoroseomonas oryzicola TaxID=535904 RepID=A0A9X9WJZ7_9PROT|nr:phospholipase D family protein [Neoroseomonas oryzicola]NKE17484.1 phospholipase D family protein [Neoroseomonas oryzicola]
MSDPSQAGVALVADGLTAFAARVAALRAATKTADLQYYVWHGDLTGTLLAREVVQAADRGVTVRLLLDDMYAIGAERVLAAMDSHPRIQVRLFNATSWRRFGPPGLILEMLFGGWHLDRRMHNKAWIVDGDCAIAGGRNIGDPYFDASGQFNFRDLDLALRGPPVQAMREVFEAYWSHRLSQPLRRISRAAYRRRALRKLSRRLERAWISPEARPYFDRLAGAPLVTRLVEGSEDGGFLPLPPAAIRVAADPPGKAVGAAPVEDCLARAVHGALHGAAREALIISPYFVPGAEGAAQIEAMARRGVRVSVVTNSLAATDVVAVHGGYARYRERLLAAGVELHELKPGGEEEGISVFGSRGASLHTKAFVVDGRTCFVGSFNLDQRSIALNTEMGTFIEDARVAGHIRDEHDRLTSPSCSWRVGLAPGGGLQWTDEGGVALRREPLAPAGLRALARLLRWLPIESKL